MKIESSQLTFSFQPVKGQFQVHLTLTDAGPRRLYTAPIHTISADASANWSNLAQAAFVRFMLHRCDSTEPLPLYAAKCAQSV